MVRKPQGREEMLGLPPSNYLLRLRQPVIDSKTEGTTGGIALRYASGTLQKDRHSGNCRRFDNI